MNHGTATIYVIDDDSSFLSAITRLIRVGGFAVDGMNTLAEFRSRLPLTEPACVLADVMLAGESGLDVVGILESVNQSAPVVFMSATDQRDTIEAASAAGVVPCLRKPLEADDLFAALETGLQQAPHYQSINLVKENPTQ
jgi:FixJ family two-component response regulator